MKIGIVHAGGICEVTEASSAWNVEDDALSRCEVMSYCTNLTKESGVVLRYHIRQKWILTVILPWLLCLICDENKEFSGSCGKPLCQHCTKLTKESQVALRYHVWKKGTPWNCPDVRVRYMMRIRNLQNLMHSSHVKGIYPCVLLLFRSAERYLDH